MLRIHYLAERINPSSTVAYIDKVQVWLRQPLSKKRIGWLRAECGEGGLHVHDGTSKWDHSFRQRLQLNQPSRQSIEWLAKRNDAHANCVEFALDWIFDDEADRDDAYAFVCRYHVKRHHHRQMVRYAGEGGVTRYTGQRWVNPNVLATYKDRHSKVTGEVYCVHHDWRVYGAAALRRMGVASFADLLKLDPHYFWLNRLLFYGIGLDGIGRAYHNQGAYRKRRSPWIAELPGGFRYNVDRRTGATIERALGSTQAVLDRWGKELSVRERHLVSIAIGHLLPDHGESFL